MLVESSVYKSPISFLVLLQQLDIWSDQDKSEVIVIPKYL